VVGLVVLVAAVAVVLAVVLWDRPAAEVSDDVPAWQLVTGMTLMGIGAVLAVVCAIRLLRDTRRRRRRGNPLQVLTVRQRRELLAAVRGRAPVDPSRAALAHHVAEGVVAQRAAVARYVAIALDRVGVAITSPTR
jgi:predicted signal transduction protein with EAL and GGDEF domain